MVHTKRKRKIAIATINEEKENESETSSAVNEPAYNSGPMYKIMSHVQTSEALHKKYVKEMQQLYTKMDHDAFLFTFIRMIKAAMACDESNDYAMTSLKFCAKFIASFDGEETHPVLSGIFDWLLKTISNNPHIRFRLCQFINMVLNALGAEAALEDAICDKILEYMVDRLLDVAPNVRVQAIIAMQRLQMPDNPDDAVVRAYQYHLCSDPSPRVRIAVITCMGRNYITIPYILDRLWDIDEKVRRHTYLHMSSYPVRSYKVSQRLTLLEQGLNDRAESVRKVVSKIMLQQWFESYQKDLLQLVAALKLDANEADIEKFRKVTKQTLQEIFKREDPKFLVELLPLDAELEFHRCVPHEKLSMEIVLYWQCLSEYLQSQMADEFDLILPELSVYCAYIEKFCACHNPEMDKFEQLEFQYKLLCLLEILYKYDLGDEIGRGNLRKLLGYLLMKVAMNERNIEIIVRCAENVIIEKEERMQFFIEIVSKICDINAIQSNLLQDRNLVNEAMANCTDSALKMKLTGLKVKILELEEQEMTFLQAKNFVKAQKVTDEKNAVTEEYSNLLKPLLAQPLELRKVKNENILTGLHVIYHMVVSVKVNSLSPQVCKLYNDFICRHMASTTTAIRDWAFKCGTAFSMHYEPIAKDVFSELYSQFFKHHIARIWETSVKCIFEILDLYGIDNFTPQEQTGASTSTATRRAGRQLYNTLENLDVDDETQVSVDGQGVGVIYMMSHFLDNCDNVSIVSEIVLGFIRLILHGYINSGDIIEKLLLRYFNPSTDTKINQYLSIFLEEMIRLKKQSLLVPSLLPTVNAVLGAPYDSPLLEIRPETITRFFIDITRQDAYPPGRHNHLHNKIAHAFLSEMSNNINNKQLSQLLAKEILKLELNVSNNPNLKKEMKEMTEKLLTSELDAKTHKNLACFKDMLDGIFTRAINAENESEDEADDDTLTNENQPHTGNTTPTTNEATSTTTAPSITNEESEPTPTITETQVNVANIINNEKEITHKLTITEKELSERAESASASADEEAVAIASVIESSSQQLSITSSQTSTESSTKQKTPTITTFGRQNQVGQRCLRRSLNNSRTQSESELSDTPKIRIEFRLDSEKKSKTTEKTNEAKKRSQKSTATASKAINSVSSRSLRMLSRLQKNKSPVATKSKDNVATNTATTTNTATSELSSNEELNTSEVIRESPVATKNSTTRIFPSTRLRRGGAATTTNTAQTTTSVSKQTRSTRNQTRQASSRTNTPRQSPQKTPTTSPRTPRASSNKRPTSAKTTPEQINKTPTSTVMKSPEQLNKTLSPKTKSTSSTTVENVPSIVISLPTTPTTTQATTSSSPTQKESTAAKLTTAKTSVRMPRKSIYAGSATLQRTGSRKRVLQKTPHPRKSASIRYSGKSDSSSSTPKSPQRKQARRSFSTPKMHSQQKRLTSKDIEQLLDETSDNSDTTTSTISTTVTTKTPIKKQTKSKAATTAKKTNKKAATKSDANRRRSATVASRLFSSEDASPIRALNTRNAAKIAYRLQNVITRKRLANTGDSSSGGGAISTSSTIASPKPVRKRTSAFSRIPIKSSKSSNKDGTTSSTSSRSSSASPLRKNSTAINDATVGGFKKPALRTRSLERFRGSRIPRKLQ